MGDHGFHRKLYYGELESRAELKKLPPQPIPTGLGFHGHYLHNLCLRRGAPQPTFDYQKEGAEGLYRARCIARNRVFFSEDVHDTWQKAREDVSSTAYALLSEESITLHPDRMPREDGQGELVPDGQGQLVDPARRGSAGSSTSNSSNSSGNSGDFTVAHAQIAGGRRQQSTGRKGR